MSVVCLLVHPFLCQFVHCPSVCFRDLNWTQNFILTIMFVFFGSLSVRFFCLSIHLSVYPLACLFISPSYHQPISLSVQLTIGLFLSLSFSRPDRSYIPSNLQFVCLSVHLTFSLSVYQSI
jgi:hypothetical protein